MTWHWIIVAPVCAAFAAFALWHSHRIASVVNKVSKANLSLLTIVCTTPNKPERAIHMRRLCERENLNPFALTTELGLFVDKNSAESGRMSAAFAPGTKPEAPAHYATYLRTLRLFLQTDFRYLLILEDDIVRSDDCVLSVQSAIANAPPFHVAVSGVLLCRLLAA